MQLKLCSVTARALLDMASTVMLEALNKAVMQLAPIWLWHQPQLADMR